MKSDLNLFVLLMIYPLTFHLLKNKNLWRFLRNLKKILKIILNFYVLCILLGGSTIFEILDLNLEERRRFINDIFIKSTKPSFLYPYFVGLAKFLTYAMPIVCRSYFSMINLYSIGPTVVKSVDIETIRHRRNSDTESNDNTSRSVIFEKYYHLTLPNPQR